MRQMKMVELSLNVFHPSLLDFRVGRGEFRYGMFLLNICMTSKARRGKVASWNCNWVWVCSWMESTQILHLV